MSEEACQELQDVRSEDKTVPLLQRLMQKNEAVRDVSPVSTVVVKTNSDDHDKAMLPWYEVQQSLTLLRSVQQLLSSDGEVTTLQDRGWSSVLLRRLKKWRGYEHLHVW